MIDYIVHGRIGQTCFWNRSFARKANNWTNGTLSNNFSHNFSYLVRKDDYLNGQGWGSSYILETYVDFGYIGLILFNLILGILLVYMLKRLGRNTLLGHYLLIVINNNLFDSKSRSDGMAFLLSLQLNFGHVF
ncbi:MAG: O-antigen polysaccharide polymerase Wzy [Coprococcus sp.]